MTPSDFRTTLALLGWSHRELARRLRCDEHLPRRWASGAAAVPAPVAAWLRALAEPHARHPEPAPWRVRAVG